MKSTTFFLLFSGLLLLGCQEQTPSPIELAEKIVASYETRSSVSYQVDYQIKFFSNLEDTSKVSAKVDLIRAAEDTVLGGFIWIDSDSLELFYDTTHLYVIQHKEKSITRFPKEKPYFITGNIKGDVISVYFLDPYRLIRGVSDTTNDVTLSEEIFSGREVWKIHYDFPDDEYSENAWKNIWIDKHDLSIPKINYSTDMQGENQYNQWDIHSVKYDSVTVEDLEKRLSEYLNSYELTEYEESEAEDIKPLPNGTEVPNISGLTYPDSIGVNLRDQLGELTLIDFWYMDCFPCVQAIPHLNDLYAQYNGKGFKVIGLNPYNNNEKDRKRLPNFLEHNPIDYSFLFIDREDAKTFQVRAYPTFYLVDTNGKIIHGEIGFNKDNTSELDSLVRINLENL